MPTTARTSRATARAAFALAVLLSAVVLFLPASGVPSALPGVDKLIHAGVFAGLAVTGRWAGMPTVALLPALVAYAVVSELIQGLPVLARSTSAADAVADVGGALAGLVLWARLTRPRT